MHNRSPVNDGVKHAVLPVNAPFSHHLSGWGLIRPQYSLFTERFTLQDAKEIKTSSDAFQASTSEEDTSGLIHPEETLDKIWDFLWRLYVKDLRKTTGKRGSEENLCLNLASDKQ